MPHSSTAKVVFTHFDNHVGTITFHNPNKHNCLSKALIAEMITAFDELEQTPIRVVILRTVKGLPVWSAGHDIRELSERGRDPLAYNIPFQNLLRRVQDFPAPVIAMIEGSVWGGACDLAFTCDLVIGTDDTSFAMTSAKIGLPYNSSGLAHFVSAVGLHKVKEMFFAAQPILPEEALRVGILNHLVPREELESFTRDLAEKICRNSPLAIRVMKQQLRLLSKGHLLDAETFERIQTLRRSVYQSEDYEEGIRAFKEKRPPMFKDAEVMKREGELCLPRMPA